MAGQTRPLPSLCVVRASLAPCLTSLAPVKASRSAARARLLGPAGGGAGGHWRWRQPAARAACTEDWQGTQAPPGATSGAAHAFFDPLLQRIAQCGSARELHLLLLRHRGELGGAEVAAALQAAAKRKLLQRPGAARSSNGSSRDGGSSRDDPSSSGSAGDPSSAALAALLAQLAEQHAPAMDVGAASAAAWSLAALQLQAARPVLRGMHSRAAQQLQLHSPPQLCSLLWAGSALDAGYHSPLWQELRGLLRRGMSLDLFTPHDLAVLALLCGREGGTVAKDVLESVAGECRRRVEAYSAAQQAAEAASAEQRPWLRPPPFSPAEAAMLVTGLAQAQLRVGGLVEPMLRQCVPRLEAAAPGDVARIVVALGELQMEMGQDLLPAILNRLAAGEDELTPRQVAASLWACTRFGAPLHGMKQMQAIGARHIAAHLPRYRPEDMVCVLWALAHFKRALADKDLLAVLHALQPGLAQCSTQALCNLSWALGRMAGIRSGAVRAAATSRSTVDWINGPVAAQLLAVTGAALAELAAQGRRLRPADLAAVALAASAHAAHASALPAAPLRTLRQACTAAAASGELSPLQLAQVAAAAARLRWQQRATVDALASAAQAHASALVCHSEAFAQLVWAMASLAPGLYARLFNTLAQAYAAKVESSARVLAYATPFNSAERQTVLASFAAVAHTQGLPHDTLTKLLGTVGKPHLTVKALQPHMAAALLALAGLAGRPPSSALVVACCGAIKRHLGRASPEALRLAQAGLCRLQSPDCDDARAAVGAQLAQLEAAAS